MKGHTPAEDNVIVSSIVVDTKLHECAEVSKTIQLMSGADVVAGHESKLVVVLETNSTDAAVALAEKIRSIKGVTGVQLVAHFFEDETRDERGPF